MAFAAFMSLKSRINSTINNPISGVSVAAPTREILESAYNQLESSEEIARKLLLSCTSRLDFEIKVAVSKSLNIMHSFKSINTIMFRPKTIEFPIDQLKDLEQEIDSFTKLMKKMEAEYVEESETTPFSSTFHSKEHRSKMIGLSNEYEDLKLKLTRARLSEEPLTVVLAGMPGISKTTLAKEIFEDRDILTHYDLSQKKMPTEGNPTAHFG